MANDTKDLDIEHKRLLNAKLDAEIEQIKQTTEHEQSRWQKEYRLKLGALLGGTLSAVAFKFATERLSRGG